MSTFNQDNRILASLAVFRELYDAKKDAYSVISFFISDLITTNSLYSFSITEITHKLNIAFDFDLPEAVIRTSLSRLDSIEKKSTQYVVKDISKVKNQLIDEKQQAILSRNDTIVKKLFDFIQNKSESLLTVEDKEKISHSFSCFLLDLNNGDEYMQYITAFIIENEEDEIFKAQLNSIREGVILYSGIKYNNNINDLGTWRSDLTIYLETEILFHLAGYNGELYKTLAEDFFSYVREINQKAHKNIIKLKYFQEVKTEVDGFFRKAHHLVEGNEISNMTTTAMVSIINGCKSPSDVLQKKTDFYYLLKIQNIEEDLYNDYFSDRNHAFNIVNEEIIEKITKEINRDSEEYLRLLNYIAIHRRDAIANNFENIGCILLSGNSTMLKVAWNTSLKEEGHVPLATHLSFLTNKFWFKLNKGFGKNSLPKSFDIITKSQIVLSKILNDSVGLKFEQLQAEYKSGKLTQELAKVRILDLRNQVRKPEEIKNDDIKDVLNTISEDSLERFIQEQNHLKNKSEAQAEQNTKLLSELESKKMIEADLFTAKKNLLQEKLNLRIILENQKAPLDIIAKNKYKTFKFIVAGGIFGYYALLIFFIFYLSWNTMEQYTYILGLLPPLVSAIFLLMTENEIAPASYLKKQEANYVVKTYKKFGFNINQLNETNAAIESFNN